MLDSLKRIYHSPKLLDPKKRVFVMALHVVVYCLLFPYPLFVRRRRPPMGPNRRILLMRIDGVGDFCMTSQLFPILRQTYPDAKIDLLCSTLAKPFADACVRSGDINTIYALPLQGRTLMQWHHLIETLKANHYDIAADLRGDFRNVLTAWAARIPRRIGIAYSGFDYLLTTALRFDELHQTEEVRRVAVELGVEDPPRQPNLTFTSEDRDFAEKWLQSREAPPAKSLVAFHLSAGMPARLWPLERFIAVARHLVAEHGAIPLVIGSPADVSLAEEFRAAVGNSVLIAAGNTSLMQSAALIARCRLFIGTDSGPAHIASAVGCPVIVLFGPGNEKVMRPFSDAVTIVRATRACDPHCHNKTCAVPANHCLSTITAQSVASQADNILRSQ